MHHERDRDRAGYGVAVGGIRGGFNAGCQCLEPFCRDDGIHDTMMVVSIETDCEVRGKLTLRSIC